MPEQRSSKLMSVWCPECSEQTLHRICPPRAPRCLVCEDRKEVKLPSDKSRKSDGIWG
jgi:hypothetical protein